MPDLLATDPPVSERQRRAMFAAREGHSTLGIPKSVGEKFVGPGHDNAPTRAAGVMFRHGDKALFLRRAGADQAGTWAFPAGGAEDGETPRACALREAREEVGDCGIPMDGARVFDQRKVGDVDFVTFAHDVPQPFVPQLNDEHDTWAWAPLSNPPQPLHPGVKATLDAALAMDPLTSKGNKILSAMEDQYGEKKGKQVFYASRNKGTISGVDAADQTLTERFKMLPGGLQVIDLHTGKAIDIDHALRVLGADAEASWETIHEAVAGKADDPNALASWIKDRNDPGWRSRGDAMTLGEADPADVDLDDFAEDKEPDEDDDDEVDAFLASLVDGEDVAQDAVAVAMDWSYCAALTEVPSGPMPVLAFDRMMVSLDRDESTSGRLLVDRAHLTKSTVSPYWGREIPRYRELGLDPDRKYMLLRDPRELATPETVASFKGLPILKEHMPASAADHPQDLVIGATGDTPSYEHPYIDASLVFWPQEAIEDIEANKKRDLSASYNYDAIMQPGVYEGQRYDGRMVNIRGNHIALVPEGRNGADVGLGRDSQIDDPWLVIERELLDLT